MMMWEIYLIIVNRIVKKVLNKISKREKEREEEKGREREKESPSFIFNQNEGDEKKVLSIIQIGIMMMIYYYHHYKGVKCYLNKGM